MSDFDSRVLTWLTKNVDLDAQGPVEVRASGSDWEGDTESGFRSSFTVDISYVTPRGKRSVTCEGSELASLWTAVVR